MTTATKELTKREQLKVVFKKTLTDLLDKRPLGSYEYITEHDADKAVNVLLKEVSIRTPLR